MSTRHQAEFLILVQECHPATDSRTLAEAVRIAHHEKEFFHLKEWNKNFTQLAQMFREKFKVCNCRSCRSNEAEAPPASFILVKEEPLDATAGLVEEIMKVGERGNRVMFSYKSDPESFNP